MYLKLGKEEQNKTSPEIFKVSVTILPSTVQKKISAPFSRRLFVPPLYICSTALVCQLFQLHALNFVS